MSSDENISVINDKINTCIDFLNNCAEFFNNDSTLLNMVYTLKNNINNHELKSNLFLQDYLIIKLDEIIIEIDSIESEDFDRHHDNKFSTEFYSSNDYDRFNKFFDNFRLFVDRNNKRLESYYSMVLQKKENDRIRNDNINLLNDNKKLKEENIVLSNTVSNKKVTDLYDDVEAENKKYFRLYRFLFLASIFMTLFFAISYDPLKSLYMNYLEITNTFFKVNSPVNLANGQALNFNDKVLKYILFKISIIVVGITLTTYFLKLSIYYQNKYEQAKQTKLELEAFPDYISLVTKETAEELRKELALKYFGKELDRTYNEKIGNLVQEQMSSSIDLVKATAEIIKSANPVSKSSNSEKK
ncbi:hypothetical protein [Acinetobacter pragensis]|nr:hypothetical protein [Acinetobacter pragensis]